MTRAAAGATTLALLGACATFEDPNIVIDLRVLAMAASHPEQLVTIDLADPPAPADLLPQLGPAEMCALVADPGPERALRWSMTLCALDNDERCTGPEHELAAGVAGDPDTAVPAPRLCATIQPDGNLLGVVLAALDRDVLSGLGGVDYGVSLRVGGAGDDPALDAFAGKSLRIVPRFPAERRANVNPALDRIDATIDPAADPANDPAPVPLPLGRCVDQAAPLELRPRQRVRLMPIEPPGVREDYVVPTLDGGAAVFTETLRYRWLAGAGSFSRGSSGGPRDFAGNPAELDTTWTAPAATGEVPLWIVMRDERLGARWYESCVRVVP